MRPGVWLGGASTGGLALPDASPAPCRFYAPRGVFLNRDLLIAVDTGNHRVLIWKSIPTIDGQPADLVLGQVDFHSEGPKSAGTSVESGFYLPTAAGVWEGRLFVADAWHHRVLVWNEVPSHSNAPPDYAIGQPDLSSVEANRGASTSREGLWCPYGIAWVKDVFYVADTGNRRILGWNGIPKSGQQPDSLLGQSSWECGEESRGEGVGARSFRWPHSIASAGEYVYVADAGNHRVLGWQGGLQTDRDADLLLGQSDFRSAIEFPYRKQGPARLRFPYAIAANDNMLAVGDTANNRILFWELSPEGRAKDFGASHVIGQPDFDANGENHWKALNRDTMCWPYGLSLHEDQLAIADSGNNRVMLWNTASTIANDNQTVEVAISV